MTKANVKYIVNSRCSKYETLVDDQRKQNRHPGIKERLQRLFGNMSPGMHNYPLWDIGQDVAFLVRGSGLKMFELYSVLHSLSF